VSGGVLDNLDDHAFYDTGDFGVEAQVGTQTICGLFDNTEIDDEDRRGSKPMFRCRQRLEEETLVVILDETYFIESVQPLETGEHVHFLSLDDA